MRKPSFYLKIFALALLGFTTSCNMPGREGDRTPTPDITQAYQTVEARLTESAFQTTSTPRSPTPSDTPSLAATSSPTIPLAVTTRPTTAVPATSAKLCDQAEAGVPIDVTIPDDTSMAPGQVYTKVWRLRNAGTCTWSKNYSFAVFSGEPMSAPNSVPLPKQVEPGQTVDISVDLVAPTSQGTYQGNWKFKNAQGAWFGIGPGGNSPFWVRIVVVQGTITVTPPTPVATSPGTTYPPPTIQFDPPVLIAGVNTMVANDRLDLDLNQLNSGNEDVTLTPNAQGRLLLSTLGNAGMAGFGTSAPSFGQCQSASPVPASVTMRNIPQGFYICYRTGQGLFGWLRVSSYNDTSGTLNLQVNTWSLP